MASCLAIIFRQSSDLIAFLSAFRRATLKAMVPLAGIEPALLAELDFESNAGFIGMR